MSMILLIILLPLAGAIGARALGKRRKRARDMLVRVTTLITLGFAAWAFMRVWRRGDMALALPDVCGLALSFRADVFRALYALVAAFMWAMTALMSRRYFEHYHNRTRYYFFYLLTLTGTLGVFFSDDLYTTFIFFEIMSMASYPWVAHDETPGALRAAQTYLGIAVLGGMVTLMGMFLMYNQIGSLAFERIRAARGERALYPAAALVLFGFLAKAGAFPLHIWLPKAHPVAPAPASALLSGVLTKTGVFGVIVISMNLFAGEIAFGNILLILALATMLLGAALALFSNNLKRTLACSSMSQIGYILTGIAAAALLGEEGALPAAGAMAHMLNHSVFKLTLFMAAGAVYMNLHALDLNDIRGFGRGKPLLHAVFLLGALGLAGVPVFSGYVSKTMIHEGLVEVIEVFGGSAAYRAAEWVFLFAAGLTTGYMLKLYIALFWQKNTDANKQARFGLMNKTYLDARARIALCLSAAWILIFGALPSQTLTPLVQRCAPFVQTEAAPSIKLFAPANLRGGLITLIIGACAYLFIVRMWMYSKTRGYIERLPEGLDIENAIYRPVFCRALPNALGALCRALDRAADALIAILVRALSCAARALNGAGERAAKWLSVVLALAARALNEFTDHIVIAIREIWFAGESAAQAPNSGYTRAARRFARAIRHSFARLSIHAKFDNRDVTDLRYGSNLTNAISFGLILCALGIVAAMLYVLVRLA